MPGDLHRGIERYVAHRLPGARTIRVDDLARIFGGASRQTYRFRLRYRDGATEVDRRLILRRDPPGSLIDTDRRNEFEAYAAFRDTPVPVPEMLWLEEDPAWLEHPFFVMEEIVGYSALPTGVYEPPRDAYLQTYGENMYTILGQISAQDPQKLGLTRVMEVPELDRCWQRELEHWERTLDEDELEPLPILRAAIRWLRRNPPPPPERLGVVHGDFRTGNWLYDDEGGIHGVLDWEMAHLGDPIEDLCWSMSPVFDFAGNGLAAGLIPRERALEIWERTSGLRVDPDRLRWWEVFAAVKGQAIWVSALHEYLEGENQDPIMAISGMSMLNRQDAACLRALGKHA
jgi:aminoglycoside phosphotransferase (APT) family kinase protein